MKNIKHSKIKIVKMRVREALSYPRCRQALRGKLPKEVIQPPEDLCTIKTAYPTTLLKYFNDVDKYSTFGIVTEALLREKDNIDNNTLTRVVQQCTGIQVRCDKKSKVLDTFLERVHSTRDKMLVLAKDAPLEYDAVVGEETGNIQGHPDARTATDIFEVKTSGRLAVCWLEFIMQVFAYAALDDNIERVHLVLPLQDKIWSWDVKELWPKRKEYKNALESFATAKIQEGDNEVTNMIDFQELINITHRFSLGKHISKQRHIAATLKLIPDPSKPYQIFLGNPSSTKVNTNDADLAESLTLIERHKLRIFIHAPYLINLASINEYNIPCLKKHLEAGAAMGARGIIVHVGKSTTQPQDEAISNMRKNINTLLEYATPECPLLLETPAGQGTELLSENVDTFMNFVASFNNTCFGACVDTCHVFSAGVRPLEYLSSVLSHETWSTVLHVVHFNDSKADIGSRVDRHAVPGFGYIGIEELTKCAELVTQHNVPLIIEA